MAAPQVEHRPLDERWLREHESDGFAGIQRLLVLLGQLAKGRPGTIQQYLPADLLAPAFETVAIDAVLLVVVKNMCDPVLRKPRTGFLHRLAIRNAVDRYGH